jgi:hypothetical protein
MKKTFLQLCESSEDIEKFDSIVKLGLKMSSDRSDTMWDDFISLANNNKGKMADLFGVKPEMISKAASRISSSLERVRHEEDSEDKRRKKRYMIHTGI